MRQATLYILFFLIHLNHSAQLVLERQAVSCLGLNVCEQQCIYSTAGQIDYQLCSDGVYTLTSGFEQPDGPLSLTVNLNVYLDECSNTYSVEVASVSNCNGESELTYVWNGTEGSDSVGGLPASTTLQIISAGGCEYAASYDFSQMTVVAIACELEFFSFLSPNDDGENDLWMIGRIDQNEYADNVVKIFNRWGSVVWETTGYNNIDHVWTGKNTQGDALPDGTYFFLVEAGGRKYNGYIELMR